MNTTRLIQRLEKPYIQDNGKLSKIANAFSFGGGYKNGGLSDEAMKLISSIFSFSYMGAAEYEFGAVPKSLAAMYELAIAKNLAACSIICGGVEVFCICNKTDWYEIQGRIKQLANDKLRTRDYVGLHKVISGETVHKNLAGWFELDNNFMFFTDKKMFEACCKLFELE